MAYFFLLIDAGFQDLFRTQKGYLDEELDFRKQSMDQAHKVSVKTREGTKSLSEQNRDRNIHYIKNHTQHTETASKL